MDHERMTWHVMAEIFSGDDAFRMRVRDACQTVRAALAAECENGHWTGELAASAISTATTVSAWVLLLKSGKIHDETLLAEGRAALPRAKKYLLETQNPDGGWGDTDRSYSNIAATMLATAALKLYAESLADTVADTAMEPENPGIHAALEKTREYLDAAGNVAGVRKRYGADKTFAVPILTNAALAGMVPWREVSPLPFECACIPHRFLGMIRLPVVSYAIPALVAIGQAVFYHRKSWNPFTRTLRKLCVRRSLRVLREKQPESGGFLEAAPLTAFVVMSLASIPRAEAIPEEVAVLESGARFLLASMRQDGSVPIDTNLATWLTSLSISALAEGENSAENGEKNALAAVDFEWLLDCQHRRIHPFTHAEPGGWGWTDLSGAVPDADDTPAAMLALHTLLREKRISAPADIQRTVAAVKMAAGWLLDLQNADGGIPTFCRGWGALPFDRSGTDLTAHAIRAWHRWIPFLEADAALAARIPHAISRGLHYIRRQQQPDGEWVPLWFGDQDHSEEENPVYGTARVLMMWHELGRGRDESAQWALAWLKAAQNADGSWGYGEKSGKTHVEQTALATEIMLLYGETQHAEKGLHRLTAWVESGEYRQAAPIGFYFAKLWYYERLYPLIFTAKTLGMAEKI